MRNRRDARSMDGSAGVSNVPRGGTGCYVADGDSGRLSEE